MGVCTTCVDESKSTGLNHLAVPFGAMITALVAEVGYLIPNNITKDQAWYEGEVQAGRLIPLLGLKNFLSPDLTPLERTANDGSRQSLGSAVRQITAEMWSTTTQLNGKVSASLLCGNVAYFPVDSCGRIKGRVTDDGLVAIKISSGSASAFLKLAVDGTNTQDTMISFDHENTEADKNHGYITTASYTFDIFGTDGLTDVFILNLVGVAATDTITFDLVTDSGDIENPLGIPGLDGTDFIITVNGGIGTTVSVISDDGKTYTIVTVVDIVAGAITVEVDKIGLKGVVTAGVAA